VPSPTFKRGSRSPIFATSSSAMPPTATTTDTAMQRSPALP
jgi:hypothetical protein